LLSVHGGSNAFTIAKKVNDTVFDLKRAKVRVFDGMTLPLKLNGKPRFYAEMLRPSNSASTGVDIICRGHSRIANTEQNSVCQPTPQTSPVSDCK
jgi:hypothetical protein